MPFDEEESIPSEKLKDIENEKVVVEPKKSREEDSHVVEERKIRFHLYMYISEGLLFLATLLSFAFALADMTFFFDIINSGSYYYLNLKLWSLVLIIPIAGTVEDQNIYIPDLNPCPYLHNQELASLSFCNIQARSA